MFQPLLPIEFLRRAARFFPEKPAVIDGSKVFTYGELERRVHRLGNALRSLGVVKGARVAILSPNTHWMFESFFGVPQIGAVLVPINYRLAPDDFRSILNHCAARALLVDRGYAAPIAAIRTAPPGAGSGRRPAWEGPASACARSIRARSSRRSGSTG